MFLLQVLHGLLQRYPVSGAGTPGTGVGSERQAGRGASGGVGALIQGNSESCLPRRAWWGREEKEGQVKKNRNQARIKREVVKVEKQRSFFKIEMIRNTERRIKKDN